MDLKRLRHVLALAKEMNFIRAAEKVHLSQPAFSRSIQALESELGLLLFDRSKQGMALTVVGKEFVARAKRLVHEAKSLERDMALIVPPSALRPGRRTTRSRCRPRSSRMKTQPETR